jgi:hypothetical protein
VGRACYSRDKNGAAIVIRTHTPMATTVDDKGVSQNFTLSKQKRKTTNLLKGTKHSIVPTSEGRGRQIQPNH